MAFKCIDLSSDGINFYTSFDEEDFLYVGKNGEEILADALDESQELVDANKDGEEALAKSQELVDADKDGEEALAKSQELVDADKDGEEALAKSQELVDADKDGEEALAKSQELVDADKDGEEDLANSIYLNELLQLTSCSIKDSEETLAKSQELVINTDRNDLCEVLTLLGNAIDKTDRDALTKYQELNAEKDQEEVIQDFKKLLHSNVDQKGVVEFKEVNIHIKVNDEDNIVQVISDATEIGNNKEPTPVINLCDNEFSKVNTDSKSCKLKPITYSDNQIKYGRKSGHSYPDDDADIINAKKFKSDTSTRNKLESETSAEYKFKEAQECKLIRELYIKAEKASIQTQKEATEKAAKAKKEANDAMRRFEDLKAEAQQADINLLGLQNLHVIRRAITDDNNLKLSKFQNADLSKTDCVDSYPQMNNSETTDSDSETECVDTFAQMTDSETTNPNSETECADTFAQMTDSETTNPNSETECADTFAQMDNCTDKTGAQIAFKISNLYQELQTARTEAVIAEKNRNTIKTHINVYIKNVIETDIQTNSAEREHKEILRELAATRIAENEAENEFDAAVYKNCRIHAIYEATSEYSNKTSEDYHHTRELWLQNHDDDLESYYKTASYDAVKKDIQAFRMTVDAYDEHLEAENTASALKHKWNELATKVRQLKNKATKIASIIFTFEAISNSYEGYTEDAKCDLAKSEKIMNASKLKVLELNEKIRQAEQEAAKRKVKKPAKITSRRMSICERIPKTN